MRSKPLNRKEVRMICNHVLAIIAKNYPNSTHALIEKNTNCASYKMDTGTGKQFELFIKGRRLPSADTGSDWDFRNLIYKKNCYYIFVLSKKFKIDVNDIDICAMSPIDIDNLLSPDKVGTNFKVEISYSSNQKFAVRRKGGGRTIDIDFDAINKI